MKYEKENELSYTLGAFPTVELLKNKSQYVTKVYLHEKLNITDDIQEILNLCNTKNIKVETNTKMINRISTKENVFIMGEFKKFVSQKIDNEDQVVLVNPSDMGNAGTIMRTALGFGYKNIVLIRPCIDVFNPKVIRSSMGAIFSLNIIYYDSIEEYLSNNKQIKKYMFMLDGKNILQNMNIDKSENYALIFGNEATGLPGFLKEHGTTVFIEHNNKIDSLNLAVSIGIGLYEFSKSNKNHR